MGKSVFQKGNADWISELTYVPQKYNTTEHNSTKMIPIDATKKVKEKAVLSNFENKRQKH